MTTKPTPRLDRARRRLLEVQHNVRIENRDGITWVHHLSADPDAYMRWHNYRARSRLNWRSEIP